MLRIFKCFSCYKNNEIHINQKSNNEINQKSNNIKSNKIIKKVESNDLILIYFFQCKYWFSLLLKYSLPEYKNCLNKKEFIENIWKCININKIFEYFQKYTLKYNEDYSENNILLFYKNESNSDFIMDIKNCTSVYF